LTKIDKQRSIDISTKLLEIDKGAFPFIRDKTKREEKSIQRTPRIMDENFLERINWVNLRTQAQFDMPCCLCGCTQDIQMHHIKHVRKTKYSLIPKAHTLQRLMSLRNRKQVPVCKACHNKIHNGEYDKNCLKGYFNSPVKLYDNRIMNTENYIMPRLEPVFAAPLEEHLQGTGWKITSQS
jgi:hypothetical protein